MTRALLARLETAVIVLPAVAALALVAEQAAARYIYHPGLIDWADEVVVYLLMWSVLASLGRVTAEGTHIRTELLVDRLPPRAARRVEMAIAVLGAAFLLMLGWLGYRVAAEAFVYDDRTASSLRFPIWFYYAFLPLACAGMVTGFVIRFLRLHRDEAEADPGIEGRAE